MCQYQVRVRGITVMGRSVYACGDGVKIGYRGPLVSLSVALADLSHDKARYLETACLAIDQKMSILQQVAPDVLCLPAPVSATLDCDPNREAEKDARDFEESQPRDEDTNFENN